MLALDGFRAAQEIALEEVEAQGETTIHHGFGLDLFGDQPEPRPAHSRVPFQFGIREGEDIQFDIVRQRDRRGQIALESKIVQRDAIAALS